MHHPTTNAVLMECEERQLLGNSRGSDVFTEHVEGVSRMRSDAQVNDGAGHVTLLSNSNTG